MYTLGPWLVALDIDGTVVHEDGTLTDAVTDAVQRVRDAGHLITLATGRSWESTEPVLRDLGLEPEFVVSANGAMTMRRDDSVEGGYRRDHVETFDARPVLEQLVTSLPDARFMVEDGEGRRLYTEGMSDWNLINAVQVPFEQLAEDPVTRVVVVSPDHEPDDFIRLIDSLGLHQVSYAIGWTAWLDIAPEGVNKGTALERARSILGVPREHVLVAGDGRNDIEMFEWAGAHGRAVAMGQSPPEVKAAATELTGDVWNAGLVSVLDSLLDG